MEKTRIVISEVIELLHNGVTRKKSDKHYVEELGSIQEKYGLTGAQVDRLFQHPTLKGVRVRPVIEDPFEIVDDLNTETTQEEEIAVVDPSMNTTIEEIQDTQEMYEEHVAETAIAENENNLDDFFI